MTLQLKVEGACQARDYENEWFDAKINKLFKNGNVSIKFVSTNELMKIEADELTERLKVNTGRNKVCAGLELCVSRLRRIRISPIALTPLLSSLPPSLPLLS